MIKHIHPIPAFQDNYIWALTSDDGRSLAVVDPGDPEPVITYAKLNNLELTHILITHHHPDHTGGLAKLTEHFAPEVFGPDSERIRGIKSTVADSDRITVFGVTFTVLEVPGHTLDHIAYCSEDRDPPLLFCGDTLFAAGCGRLFEGNPAMMSASLAKLTDLKDHTEVYCTHEYTLANIKFALAANGGNQDLQSRALEEQRKRDNDEPTLPSTIGLELATNPFLRCQDPDVVANAEKQVNRALSSPLEVFTALRSWKDNF